MREVQTTIYEASDYEKARDMSLSDVINVLDSIDDNCIASSRYYGQKDFEGDEMDYDDFVRHQALRIAMDRLADLDKGGKKS